MVVSRRHLDWLNAVIADSKQHQTVRDKAEEILCVYLSQVSENNLRILDARNARRAESIMWEIVPIEDTERRYILGIRRNIPRIVENTDGRL